jgi:hypothetical protein
MEDFIEAESSEARRIAGEALSAIGGAGTPLGPIIHSAMRVAALRGHAAEFFYLWSQIANKVHVAGPEFAELWDLMTCRFPPDEIERIVASARDEVCEDRRDIDHPERYCALLVEELQWFVVSCYSLEQSVGFGGDKELEETYGLCVLVFMRLRTRVEDYLREQSR